MTEGNEAGVLDTLAERCEQATGPDIQLDADIRDALELPHDYGSDSRGWGTIEKPKAFPYTASLDAAMTLVPEGVSFTLYRHPEDCHCEVFRLHPSKGLLGEAEMAKTPALALCVAALRARSTQTQNGGQR